MSSTSAGLCAVVVAVTFGVGPGTRQASLHEALDLYARGEHSAALAVVDPDTLTTAALLDRADQWLQTAPVDQQSRRRLIAAAFALDLTWNSTRNEHNVPSQGLEWTRGLSHLEQLPLSHSAALLAVVVWGCDLVIDLELGDPAGRWWWLASVGALQDAVALDPLLGDSRLVTSRPLEPRVVRALDEGHLAHARGRFSDERRWKLVEAVARSQKRVGPVDRVQDLTGLRRADVLRDERHDRSEAIAGFRRAFERLAREQPRLSGEAWLHAGYLELLARRWREALERFERARPLLNEPVLLAALDYFSGWAHDRLDQRAEARAAYDRAHVLAPAVRNLSTLLAAQLFRANERTRAYEVLEAGLQADPVPLDLRILVERGEARLVPMYLERMREALR
jgi:tetratricopeptide (TPR) repeat protein